MGAYQNNPKVAAKKSGRRGSVRNDKRLDAFGKDSPEGVADWGTCNPHQLQNVVMHITQLGGACTFGLSRDKGAHMLTLLLDDSRKTLWFNGDADLDADLQQVVDTLKDLK